MKIILEMESEELSLVKEGANGRGKKRRFPITKGLNTMADDDKTKEVLLAVLEVAGEKEEEFFKALDKVEISEKGKAATEAAYRLLKGFSDELPKEAMEAISKATGFVPKAVEDDNKKKEQEAIKKAAELKKKKEQDELKKSLDEKIVKQAAQIESLEKSQENIKKALEASDRANGIAIWLRKAEKELSHYPGKTSVELAEQFYDIEKKVGEDFAKQQFDVAKVASGEIKKSLALKAIGNPLASEAGSALEKIDHLVKEKIKKSAKPLDAADAYCAVVDENPELYEQSESEKKTR